MRMLAFSLATSCLLIAGIGSASAQSSEDMKYYAATTESGNPAPRPGYPGCTLVDIGGTPLWACPQSGEGNARSNGAAGEQAGRSGFRSADNRGGMDGGDDDGGMDGGDNDGGGDGDDGGGDDGGMGGGDDGDGGMDGGDDGGGM